MTSQNRQKFSHLSAGTSLASLETRGPTMSPVSLQSLSDLPIKPQPPVKLEAMESSPPPLTLGLEPQMPVLEAEPATMALDSSYSPATEHRELVIMQSSPPPVSPTNPGVC